MLNMNILWRMSNGGGQSFQPVSKGFSEQERCSGTIISLGKISERTKGASHKPLQTKKKESLLRTLEEFPCGPSI